MNDKTTFMEIKNLRPFAGHPYKVRDNEEMAELTESIRAHGVLSPILVRPMENSTTEYEIVSGHRRVMACRKAGITTIPAFVISLDRDGAAILLVDSNLHREHILPSEKAYAYKLKMEAMKRQGKRTDLTLSQVATKLDAAAEIGKDTHESRDTVFRYIRLTNLIPELLQYVDDGKIALTPAVELSFLPKEFQRELWEQMQLNDCTPSYSQANQFKKAYQAGNLTAEMIADTMAQEKANQKERLKIPMDRVRKFFPRNYTAAQMEAEIIKLCEERYRKRQRAQER